MADKKPVTMGYEEDKESTKHKKKKTNQDHHTSKSFFKKSPVNQNLKS